MKKNIFTICLLWLAVSCFSSPNWLKIDENTHNLEFHSSNVECFVDTSNHLTINDIRGKDFKASLPNFLTNNVNATYWLKFPLISNDKRQRKWVFEVLDAHNEIVEVLRPKLKENGLYFVGIDIIGEYLIEVNVTSPTCLQEISAVAGHPFEEDVISFVENLVDQYKCEDKIVA